MDRLFQGIIFGLVVVCLLKNIMQDSKIEAVEKRVDVLILTVKEATDGQQ